jgi:integrase
MTSGRRYTVVRIPKSDWLKLRDELGYGKTRIVEVSEETYKLVEEYIRKLRARSLDDAIHEAVLSALHEGN